jgi:glyoxylase-like metal-dependent hydrolase (beta-lactamase superfamily II)
MQVQQITPGLWRWTAWHPEWKEDVGCVYYEGRDAIVLIDPLVPEDEADRFWRALDRDVEHGGRPVHVLITIFWHTRSAREVAERYGARIWAPSRGRAAVERRSGLAGEAVRPGAKLPGGAEAFSTARGTEVVYWIPEHRALVPGDVILGGLRLCPESWLPEKTGHGELRASLRPLLDLPVERVLVSHGEPVLAGGRAALAQALGA